MSLRPRSWDVIPDETARVARMVFPEGCLAMRARDVLGSVFADTDFTDAFPRRDQPGLSPALLALVSVLQFAEGLSDRQAAHAVRARIDWKYALGLELADQGFDYSVLSEFRARLIAGGMQQRVLDAVVDAAARAGLLSAGGRQRTDSTHVLAVVRDLNRLQFVTETLRSALNALAAAAPHWLASLAEPEWFDRYSARSEDTRFPSRWAARTAHADQVGTDGMVVLSAVAAPTAPVWLRELAAVELLRQVWVQQYHVVDGQIRWRDKKDLPPAGIRYCSPYDPQARTGTKRAASWNGYKIHLTETCEPDAPHLITHVTTTPAPVPDMAVTEAIHTRLAERELLPQVHLVDAGYIDAEHLVTAREKYDIELLGPAKPDSAWQVGVENGFTLDQFSVDWDSQRVTCPTGKTATSWNADQSQDGVPVVRVRFPVSACRPCPVRDRCTRSSAGRRLTLRHRAQHDVLQQARTMQQTEQWQQRYQHRAGVEGTVAQAVRSFGLRRSRYHGLAKTGLQHLLTAAGINLHRLNAWWQDIPFAATRTSHFAALRPTG
ncbi:IS1182 family transposase [Kutzneria sp. CA-103260]|uniref:IS1182 family transposase n=1 Tax=Kutzneria sp. CA-103260 TaxID=2802641 RepID=UPI001BA8A651|nr:IS1182 family transposase [Kutzneria sp. CA-103260]QUQ72443.1 IS1182 family transposase ISSdi1 [Kutzneria sp. CA-103260]